MAAAALLDAPDRILELSGSSSSSDDAPSVAANKPGPRPLDADYEVPGGEFY